MPQETNGRLAVHKITLLAVEADTMEITKRGKTKDEKNWLGTCWQCKSEAKAVETEMTRITSDPREGGSFSWEKCPVCGAGSESGYGGMLFYPEK